MGQQTLWNRSFGSVKIYYYVFEGGGGVRCMGDLGFGLLDFEWYAFYGVLSILKISDFRLTFWYFTLMLNSK